MEFLNNIELEVKAFFFNAETDYLPYYKNFSFTVNKTDKETKLKQLLPMIKEQNPMFFYPEEDLIFRVNDLVVTGEEQLSAVVKKLGTELTIEPALKFRSNNGLIIDNSDFMHQYRTVFARHYAEKEDLEYYISLYPLHYASETFNYNREYIGDAILLTAAKMIERNPDNKDEILAAINDEFNGINCCEYENNVFEGEDYSETINALKNEIKLTSSKSLMEKIGAACLNKVRKEVTVDSLEGKNIALYVGDKNSDELVKETNKAIENIGNLITFSMSCKRAGQSLVTSNHELAQQKAGTVLLEALDAGAEVLIFTNDEDCSFFGEIVAEVESAVGREIELAFITLSKFNEMSSSVEA
ncbi:MAG: hypothetical protein K0U38_00750 [Epsilonproteobacteria bacterium]|nr:hypothetical protein [Campylobacterota bacterium]